jgi:hypothetical protein
MKTPVLYGLHPKQGALYAAVDPAPRFTAPQVRTTRLGALLAPFPTPVAALEALRAAGAVVCDDHGQA